MRLLVVHQNFPGQFGHFVREWASRPDWDVRALARETAPGLPGFGGLTRYSLHRKLNPTQHPYLRQMEAATLHGQAAARAMLKLRGGGFTPDVILAHPGWGETLYAKDVFPSSRLVHYCEWFYHADGADLGFDPEFPISFDDRARIRTWNALHTLNLSQCDAAVTPTEWQRSRHPEAFRSKIQVCHEGIATEELGPNPEAFIDTPSGARLRAGEPIVTFVARNLEPYRGFHVFMRALEKIQARHPSCQAIIVGGDEVSYGKRPSSGTNWREHMLGRVSVDPSRTHFMGRIPREAFIRTLQVSSAHIYLTYPFVLSWSLLEAMACAVPIIASSTEPVREVIIGPDLARLVGFFEVQQIADEALALISMGDEARAMGRRARVAVQQRSLQHGLMSYERLLGFA